MTNGCILHLTFTHPKGAPLLQWADTHNLPSIFEGIQIPVLDYLNDVGVDALGDVPEGSAGGGGLHVVDDVPDDGDADEEGDEEEALEEGGGVGRGVGDHGGLAQLEDVEQSEVEDDKAPEESDDDEGGAEHGEPADGLRVDNVPDAPRDRARGRDEIDEISRSLRSKTRARGPRWRPL